MKVLLFMSVFWTLYGIAGLLGYQNIPKNLKVIVGPKSIFVTKSYHG